MSSQSKPRDLNKKAENEKNNQHTPPDRHPPYDGVRGGTTAINAGDAHYGRHAGFTGSNTQRYINLVNYTTENK